MQEIKKEQQLLDPNGQILLPAMKAPGFRRQLAIQRGVERELLIKVWGGIGDQICAHNTLRFALDTLKDFNITLGAISPELFSDLKFKNVYNILKGPFPEWDKYHVFDAMCSHGDVPWDYVCHIYIHCIDASSIYAFRSMLPSNYREIKIDPPQEVKNKVDELIKEYNLDNKKWVIIHPGRHWQSKTFPKWWWDRVLERIKKENVIPVIVGGKQLPANETEMERSTVDVDVTGCIDFRYKLSIIESLALVQRAKVVLTNDSCVLHMAASSDAWIGYITMAKHPDFLTHTRKGIVGWRQQNFGKGGIWDITHVLTGNDIMNIGRKMFDWLPEPELLAEWALDKVETEE